MSTKDYAQFRAGKSKEIERLETQARALPDIFHKQVQLLKIRKGSRVLDAGCGTGSFARNVASIVFPEIIRAVDLDLVFIEEGKRLAAVAGKMNITFHVGNLENLDFLENGTVDVTYCGLVLPHIENPVRVIQELKRVTRKGGVISFSDQGGLYTYPPIDRFFDLFGRLSEWRRATQTGAVTEKVDADELCKSAGLQNVTIYPIPEYASASESPEKLRSLSLVPLQMLELYKDDVISKGFMTSAEYEEGVKQLEEWLARPDAFWMVLTILTTGTV